jgi:hypothetical protein
MNENFTKYTFTESVKQVQEQYGSRDSYARMEQSGDRNMLTDREIAIASTSPRSVRMVGLMFNFAVARKGS